ncbi:hypothetical protein [Stygiobacter electus]|uniref:Uncharacterized protein n=1 Tax=Stygiobacter electus TaxID=3032292 RepID=A0AAE3NYL2_9BACT|nr:hypothetical protein [Stygiobacter electus]MDF1612441.1 hypothetical protein [Stygiobacter electus]
MNKTILPFFFFLSIFTITCVFSQDFNRSIVVEVPIINTELHYQKYAGLQKIDEYYLTKYSSGINISYSWRFPLLLNNRIEIRPGIFLSDLDLLGLDFGLYLRLCLYKKLFAIIGSNVHYNFGYRESHMTWSRSSQSGFYFSPGGSIGLAISQKISVFLGYYVSVKNNWRDSW